MGIRLAYALLSKIVPDIDTTVGGSVRSQSLKRGDSAVFHNVGPIRRGNLKFYVIGFPTMDDLDNLNTIGNILGI